MQRLDRPDRAAPRDRRRATATRSPTSASPTVPTSRGPAGPGWLVDRGASRTTAPATAVREALRRRGHRGPTDLAADAHPGAVPRLRGARRRRRGADRRPRALPPVLRAPHDRAAGRGDRPASAPSLRERLTRWSPVHPPAPSPTRPGSYQFKDEDGRVIYVGKAKSLRSRLSNYFGAPHTLLPRTRQMVHGRGDGRVDRGPQRGRGAVPRVQPHQGAPAAVQHPAEGRQVVPVPRGDPRRGVAAGDGHAGQEAQGRPLLRSVRPRVRDPRDARPPAAHVPDPHLHQRQVPTPPAARPAVPLRPHREVRRAVRRRGRPTTSTARSSTSCSRSSTARPRRCSTGSRSRCTRPPTSSSSSGRPGCATSSPRCARPSSASRWSGPRTRTSTSSGSPTTSSRRRCRSSSSAAGGSSGGRGSSSTRSRTSTRRRSSPAMLEQLYGDAEPSDVPKRGAGPGRAGGAATSTRSSSALVRGSQGADPGARSAGEKRALLETVDAQRGGGVHPAQAQARVRPQRAGQGARRAAGGARPARGAVADRVLRHLEPAGHRDRRVDDGARGRHPEALRLPALQDPAPGGPGRLRRDGGGADAAGSGATSTSATRVPGPASGSRTRRTCS